MTDTTAILIAALKRIKDDNVTMCDLCRGYGEIEISDRRGYPERTVTCPRCEGSCSQYTVAPEDIAAEALEAIGE